MGKVTLLKKNILLGCSVPNRQTSNYIYRQHDKNSASYINNTHNTLLCSVKGIMDLKKTRKYILEGLDYKI